MIFRIIFLFLLKIAVKIISIYAGTPAESSNGIPHQDQVVQSGENADQKVRASQ